MSELSWHQQARARRHHLLRNKKAHMHGEHYIATGLSLCGIKDPPVYVEPEHAHKPVNNVCKKCLAKLSSHSGETK